MIIIGPSHELHSGQFLLFLGGSFTTTLEGRNINSKNCYLGYETCLKRGDISNFCFHDLRHSYASYLAMNRASLLEIAELLGHKTLAMVKRYAHLTEAHTRSVVERMNRAVFGE